jgi:hypothetical protein
LTVNDGDFGEVKVTANVEAQAKAVQNKKKKGVKANKGPAAAAAKRAAKGNYIIFCSFFTRPRKSTE